MNLSLILFLIGILGFVLNRKNIILMLISIEIMLLAITFLILVSSLSYDDILGQTYAIYIITVAGAESAIGLGILVAFYRLHYSLITNCLSLSIKIYSKNNNPFSSKPCTISYFNRGAKSYHTKAFNNPRSLCNNSGQNNLTTINENEYNSNHISLTNKMVTKSVLRF